MTENVEFLRALQEPNGTDWDERKTEYESASAVEPTASSDRTFCFVPFCLNTVGKEGDECGCVPGEARHAQP